MKHFAIIIFILSALQVKAQYPSDNGRFTVDEKSGCASFTVNVTAPECDGSISCTAILGNLSQNQNITTGSVLLSYPNAGNFTLTIVFGGSQNDGHFDINVLPNLQPTFELYSCTASFVKVKVTDTKYDQYVINYNGTLPEVIVPKGVLAKDNHFFTTNGNKTVSVRGWNFNAKDNCISSSQTVDVTSALQPAFISTLEVLSASEIKLDYNTSPISNEPNTQYKVEIATDNFTGFGAAPGPLIFNTVTTTITGPRTEDNFFCFRLGTIDACNSPSVPISYSNVICSANFDLDIQNKLNTLKWKTYSAPGSNVTDFEITKTPGTPITAIPSSEISYPDIDITCNTDYCYRLVTNYVNGPRTSQSISIQKCGKAFSDVLPTPVEDISAIVSETGAALTWLQDPAFTPTEYSLYKSTNNNYSFLANTTTPTYSDPTYLTESNSCYKISYVDACLNASSLTLSAESCPIRLSGSLLPNNNISLSWSAYTGWKNGVDRYEIQKFNSQGQLIDTIDPNGTTATTHTDATLDPLNQTYVYIIKAFANDAGVSESVSNAIRITKEPYLTYPTAFSPRGNEPKNQTFKVFGQYVSSFELRIFNRWGQEMFYTNDFSKGWDGTYNGNLMPEGTYVFTAKIRDFEGKTSDRSGTVVLLKK